LETGYDRDREVQARRLVLTVTNQHRESLGSQFESWVRSLGFSLDDILANHQQRIDDLNSLLVRYGRCLYSSGRPYNHFAETTNAVSLRKLGIWHLPSDTNFQIPLYCFPLQLVINVLTGYSCPGESCALVFLNFSPYKSSGLDLDKLCDCGLGKSWPLAEVGICYPQR
jgi:hypothetical protein